MFLDFSWVCLHCAILRTGGSSDSHLSSSLEGSGEERDYLVSLAASEVYGSPVWSPLVSSLMCVRG